MIALLGALCWAQSDPPLEIVVWGRLAIDRAEDEIVHTLEEMGYETRRRGDQLVFRPPRAWMGAVVFEEGLIDFRQPVAGLQAAPPEAFVDDPRHPSQILGPDGRPLTPIGAGPTAWILPSKRKLAPHRSAVRQALEPQLAHYRAVVAKTALEESLIALPDRLDAVWRDGVPLSDAAGPLTDPAARRAHVLAYWASRPETPEGDRVCAAVEAWLRAVVQTSDHPITAAERERHGAQRTSRSLP